MLFMWYAIWIWKLHLFVSGVFFQIALIIFFSLFFFFFKHFYYLNIDYLAKISNFVFNFLLLLYRSALPSTQPPCFSSSFVLHEPGGTLFSRIFLNESFYSIDFLCCKHGHLELYFPKSLSLDGWGCGWSKGKFETWET